jgi:prophage DNA circulation protein
MSWLERLRKDIQLTSPSGAVFNALWQRNPRSMEKKLGIFQYPKVQGAIVQDLDVGPVRYPLTLFFEGSDHDLEAERFFTACKERGLWQVVHPVRGALLLQLVSFTETIDPLNSGNVTQVETAWIEPLTEAQLPSEAQLQGQVANQIDELNSSSADQLVANVVQETAGEVSAFRTAVNSVVAATRETLDNLSELNAEVNAQVASIRRGIDSVLAVVPMDILSLAGQVQQLIQLPALAIADIEARIDTYENFAAEIFNLDTGSANNEGRNSVAVKELALVSGLAAISDISTTGAISSRVQSIELVETSSAMLNDIINNLDATQETFLNTPIDIQYFSQSNSFSSTALLTAQTIAYLLQRLFALAIEKRFILDRRRSPIEITISEYGSLGVDDSNFDVFINTNSLEAEEIIILEAGREVVVYV